jgi:CheY-like chemotaxis protein
VLVIHDDGDALDLLTRLFEASGFDVVTAVTGFRAQAHLESDRAVHVVVAPWDAGHAVGGDVYRWSLQKRYDLRAQFVFIAAEVPVDFDKLVAGRCLAVSMTRPSEIIRVAHAATIRRGQLEADRDVVIERDRRKAQLMLVEDEPVLLMVMASLLEEAGYQVRKVENGHAAIKLLESEEDFDVLITDWHMDEGSGADVYRWIARTKPWLAERVVFLSGGESDDAGNVAPGRPMFRKGQDSVALQTVIREIVRQKRHELSSGSIVIPI